jgi:hypothetical protein
MAIRFCAMLHDNRKEMLYRKVTMFRLPFADNSTNNRHTDMEQWTNNTDNEIGNTRREI